MMMFGHIDDMLTYWSAPLSNASEPMNGIKVLGDLLSDCTPEVYLCESYLRCSSHPCERTLHNWWKVLARSFLVVDRSSLGFFWPKYLYGADHCEYSNDECRNLALCTLRDWINIAVLNKQCRFEFDKMAGQRLSELL